MCIVFPNKQLEALIFLDKFFQPHPLFFQQKHDWWKGFAGWSFCQRVACYQPGITFQTFRQLVLFLWRTEPATHWKSLKYVFFIFYHFGYHCIHHVFIIYFIIFIFFIISGIIVLSFFNHFCIIFLTCFYHFFKSFFILFASSGANIFQKMENYNFPSFFSFFYHFFHFLSCFYHFCFQWWNWWKMIKNDKNMIKTW